MTSKTNKVEVDLWYSTSLDLGLRLSDELAALSFSFQNDHSKKPLFTPRVATFSCATCDQDFKEKNCLSNGTYCAYTPKFFDEYKMKNADFELTGREILIQSLREKCLHDIISEKYHNEGVIFWTFFKYLDNCFVENGVKAKSLDDCYDWSTVKINGVDEVGNLNKCVKGSFAVFDDLEAENKILAADKAWSNALNLHFHPSVVINNSTYNGDIKG